MKKILFTIMAIFISESGYSADVCVKNNTYMVALKHDVAGTSSDSDATKKIWRVVFPYITLTGDAACNEMSGTENTPLTNLYTNAIDTGINCWCRMWPITDYNYETGPSSYWIFLKSYDGIGEDETTCASSCAGACATAMQSNQTFRTAVFESMW